MGGLCDLRAVPTLEVFQHLLNYRLGSAIIIDLTNRTKQISKLCQMSIDARDQLFEVNMLEAPVEYRGEIVYFFCWLSINITYN